MLDLYSLLNFGDGEIWGSHGTECQDFSHVR